ncbi:hypothetical protein FACS189440_09420 [Bacteroidia bacterium]|nr:hypothetical protein FACS189440_09420 [Bacteroidia bacterium]
MDCAKPFVFKSFYAAYYNRCFLFAKSYVHDDWVAEDIASESLIKIWEISQSEELENPKTLLFTIVKHKALDHLKHQAIRMEVLAQLSDNGMRELEIRISNLEASNPEKIFAANIRDIINTTLAGLPEQTRSIFEMYRFRNLSKKEIAERYNISIKGVDYHLSKALNVLRENLKDYVPAFYFFIFFPR